MATCRLAVPNKGRFYTPCRGLLAQAGLLRQLSKERQLEWPSDVPGWIITFVRARDIPNLLQHGVVALGITGSDYAAESGFDLRELLDLRLVQVRLSLLVPQDVVVDGNCLSHYLREIVVVTQYPNLTRRFLASYGVCSPRIYIVAGAAEAYISLGIGQAAVDIVASGETARLNGLREAAILDYISLRLYGAREATIPQENTITSLLQRASLAHQ